MLVEKKDTKQVYALKSLRKEVLINKDQVENTRTEKYILENVIKSGAYRNHNVCYFCWQSNCPFIVNSEYAFQTPEKVFFVMKFMQ